MVTTSTMENWGKNQRLVTTSTMENWKNWVEKSKVGNNQHNVSTSPLTADSRTVQGKKHKGAAYNREYP